ncbi:hypothetical protein DPEC_G00251390 [Dallia pectoralis]|uniref:Uncharacterized protein n=1 Tax=Dallia pectoralis TaxID=75939 RepID=A0ACC2FTK4_DALPE|nr:hypothetical protein DPEC_G00251390 [Dallia pectoralis]
MLLDISTMKETVVFIRNQRRFKTPKHFDIVKSAQQCLFSTEDRQHGSPSLSLCHPENLVYLRDKLHREFSAHDHEARDGVDFQHFPLSYGLWRQQIHEPDAVVFSGAQTPESALIYGTAALCVCSPGDERSRYRDG